MPVIFGCTIILIVLINYEIRRHASTPKESVQAFLKKELEANTTRKKDISGLPYRIASTDPLPDIRNIPDPEGEILAAYNELQEQNGKQLLNLSCVSNTDLKLTYGAANFPVLSACDENFTQFVRGLQKLGKLLSDAGATSAAIQTLEYAVHLDTDLVSSYRLLASLYRKTKNSEALTLLAQKAESLPDELRTSVLPYIL